MEAPQPRRRVVTLLTGLGELQLQPHVVCFCMLMQMWSSVCVQWCRSSAGPAPVDGAEFVAAPNVASLTSETAVLVHGNVDPSRGLTARGLTVRRPWQSGTPWASGKTCCLGISCSKLFRNIIQQRGVVGHSAQADWQLKNAKLQV